MSPNRKTLLERTREVWQPLSDKPLTDEDAREIVHNVTAYFSLLIELEAELCEAGEAPRRAS